MAKAKLTRPAKTKSNSFWADFELEKYFPEKYHIPVVIATIVILFLIFLKPLFFEGKSFQSGDIIASQSVQPYLQKAHEGFTLWNPHIFCGMPSYSITVGYTWFNLVYVVASELRHYTMGIFEVDYTMWVFYLFILGITTFFLMKHLTRNTLISLFSSLAMSFSTGIIVFLYIGHVTKLTALCMFPLIFLMLLRMQKKIKLLDFIILALSLQFMIQGFHVQIIFYLFLTVAIYYLYFLVYSTVKKLTELRTNIVKSLGLLVLAAGIAMAIQADNFTQIYEYTPYSTRGTKSAKEMSSGANEQSTSDYYDYHTDWSFSPGEVLTFIVPSYYGFGNVKYSGPLSQGQTIEVNTYFGQMKFVDVAMYMGVIVFFLAIFGMATRIKEPLVQFLTAVVVLSLLLSFGRNFPLVFDLFFKYFPSFDKFRVPSMILVLVQFCMPLLAGLGLEKMIRMREEDDTKAKAILKFTGLGFGVLFVLSLVLNQAIAGWFMTRVNESRLPENYHALGEFMAQMFTGDLFFALAGGCIVFAMGYFTAVKKLSPSILIIGVIFLTMWDLWSIDNRGCKYVDAPQKNAVFPQPEYVNIIRNQKDADPYRILNLKQDGSLGSFQQNSNFNMYYLFEDFYGYSAVKPRAYQDMMDVVGIVNKTLWRMGNVRYLILDEQVNFPGLQMLGGANKEFVYKNNNALPRYFFVSNVEKKNSMEVLQAIKAETFDPGKTAFTEVDAPKVEAVDSTATIKVVKYTDEISRLEVNATGNNFLVFSATYHPKGWKATVDGNPVELYRADHAFMGIVVPKGKHVVEFNFAPTSFYVSKYAALSLSSLLFLGLIVGVYLERRKKIA